MTGHIEIRLGAVVFSAVIVARTGPLVSARAVDQAARFTSLDGGRSWRLVRCVA